MFVGGEDNDEDGKIGLKKKTQSEELVRSVFLPLSRLDSGNT